LGIKKLNLLTTPEAKIDKMILRSFDDEKEFIQRKSFDELIEKVPKINYSNNNDEEKCSKIEQRPYLVKTTKDILENIKNYLKIQWPCGLGKTYLALNLHIQSGSDGVDIFITPWRALGRQVLKECDFLGVKACLIGDGNKKKIDKDCKFVICIYDSMKHIPKDFNFRFKFGDEGHHLEGDGKIASEFREIKAEKTILLSATFINNKDINYLITKREAIDQGYITDYKLVLQYYYGTREDALLKMICENVDWFPLFIYFNSTEKAKNFTKLLRKNGVSVDYLIGSDKESKRTSRKWFNLGCLFMWSLERRREYICSQNSYLW
jgi:RNAse (barnase) inhibitor barstar